MVTHDDTLFHDIGSTDEIALIRQLSPSQAQRENQHELSMQMRRLSKSMNNKLDAKLEDQKQYMKNLLQDGLSEILGIIMKKLKQGELIFPGVYELEHLWQFEIVM